VSSVPFSLSLPLRTIEVAKPLLHLRGTTRVTKPLCAHARLHLFSSSPSRPSQLPCWSAARLVGRLDPPHSRGRAPPRAASSSVFECAPPRSTAALPLVLRRPAKPFASAAVRAVALARRRYKIVRIVRCITRLLAYALSPCTATVPSARLVAVASVAPFMRPVAARAGAPGRAVQRRCPCRTRARARAIAV